MKKVLAFMLMLVSLISSAQARDVYTQDKNVLPAAAQNTLSKYFSKKKVNHIKIDKKYVGSDDYEVVLNDGTEIEFDGQGLIKEVDAGTGVPSGLLLPSISDYVKKNFKGAIVTKLEVDRNSYEVELSTGVELKFDRSGRFLKMDY